MLSAVSDRAPQATLLPIALLSIPDGVTDLSAPNVLGPVQVQPVATTTQFAADAVLAAAGSHLATLNSPVNSKTTDKGGEGPIKEEPALNKELVSEKLEGTLKAGRLDAPGEGQLHGSPAQVNHHLANNGQPSKEQSASSQLVGHIVGGDPGTAADSGHNSNKDSGSKDATNHEGELQHKGAEPGFTHTIQTEVMNTVSTSRSPGDQRSDVVASQPPAVKADAPPSTREPLRSGEIDGAAQTTAANPTELSSLSVVHSARLVQSLNQSEMRLGMHSLEFGNISIQASLNRDRMAAQISVDNRDLNKALSVHLPEMQTMLDRDHGMHSRIALQTPTTGSGDQGQASRRGTDSQERESAGRPLDGKPGAQSIESVSMPAGNMSTTAMVTRPNLGGRLDLRI